MKSVSGLSDRAAGVLLSATLVIGGIAGLYRLGQVVPLVQRNLHGLIALVFILLPQLLLRRRGNIERYGFTWHPVRLGLVLFAVATVVVLPVYVASFVFALRTACLYVPRFVEGLCAHIAAPHWRLPPDLLATALGQLLVVALPEELFFRAFVQGRLQEIWPPRRRLWGAPVGRAWLVTALVFGVGHFVVLGEPQMLTRFFPGLLFGWMYARTGSILAGTLFHAACNVTVAIVAASLF